MNRVDPIIHFRFVFGVEEIFVSILKFQSEDVRFLSIVTGRTDLRGGIEEKIIAGDATRFQMFGVFGEG